MSEATLAPPPGAGAATFLLTVRGKARAAGTEEARTTHNSTAGNPAGVEAARSLGDLSHQVFTGYGDAQAGEVLFIDFWNSLPGLGRFFSDPQVLAGADLLFSSRDAPLWAATSGFAGFHLTIPAGKAGGARPWPAPPVPPGSRRAGPRSQAGTDPPGVTRPDS